MTRPVSTTMPFPDHRTCAEWGSICRTCATPLSTRNRTGLCRLCVCREMGRSRRKPRLNCEVCGKQLGVQNKVGLCRPHFIKQMNADPEISRRRVEGIRKDSKERIHQKRMVLKANARRALQRPEYREQLRRQMKVIQPRSQTPEALAKVDYRKRGRQVTEARLGWCPPEYRDLHRYNVRSKRMLSAESRRQIEAMIREKRRNMTFEEKLQAVAEGRLGITANERVPSKRYDITLGGVSEL